MMFFHIVSMIIVKTFTSVEFKNDGNYYTKLMHVVENINCSYPYKDWDEDRGRCTTKEEFKTRFHNTENEMVLSQLLNIGVSIFMLIPIWFTCQCQIIYNSYFNNCLTDFNMTKRHELLARTIGVKKEEEDSLASATTLVITATTCIITFSILEVALYLLYNRLVSITLNCK